MCLLENGRCEKNETKEEELHMQNRIKFQAYPNEIVSWVPLLQIIINAMNFVNNFIKLS